MDKRMLAEKNKNKIKQNKEKRQKHQQARNVEVSIYIK